MADDLSKVLISENAPIHIIKPSFEPLYHKKANKYISIKNTDHLYNMLQNDRLHTPKMAPQHIVRERHNILAEHAQKCTWILLESPILDTVHGSQGI